jgi:hypothetical protein
MLWFFHEINGTDRISFILYPGAKVFLYNKEKNDGNNPAKG